MPWMSYLALTLALLVAGDVGADVDERKLNAQEIVQALTGNTVAGVWGKTPYRSYFAPDGITIYQPEGGPPDRGKWRVDGEAHRSCSHWERSGWSCYDLYRNGDTLIWEIPGEGTRYSSVLLAGRQM